MDPNDAITFGYLVVLPAVTSLLCTAGWRRYGAKGVVWGAFPVVLAILITGADVTGSTGGHGSLGLTRDVWTLLRASVGIALYPAVGGTGAVAAAVLLARRRRPLSQFLAGAVAGSAGFLVGGIGYIAAGISLYGK